MKVGSKLPDVELILPSAEAPTSDSFVTTLDLFQGASSAKLALSNHATSSRSQRKAAKSCACSAAAAELWSVVDSEQFLVL